MKDYPFGTEREVGFGFKFGNIAVGFNFSEEYEPYGGEGFESSTNEPKAFLGVGAGFYFVVGFEFSMGWDLIELKDRLRRIWG